MENQVITYTDYSEYKKKLDAVLQRSAEDFVKIGYMLKVARDTNILKDSGYANMNEFAQKEYGLDKTQVSRFININDKFSEDGYSEQLRTEYRGFGYAKLSIMLLLPDEVNHILSPSYSKAEIQAVKEEVEEEKKISDIEVILEQKNEMQQGMKNNLEKAVNQLGRDEPELYAALHEQYTFGNSVQVMKETMAPAGERLYSVRIAGVGRIMLTIKETEDRVKLVNVRTGEMEEYTWGDMKLALADNMNFEKTPEESWEEIYGEKFPKKEKVAPVQPKESKPVQRKESKISKAKVKEPVQQPETEPQIEGQRDIYSYPECVPEGMEKPQEAPKETETEEETQQSYRKLMNEAAELQELVRQKNYEAARQKCRELLCSLNKEVPDEEYTEDSGQTGKK